MGTLVDIFKKCLPTDVVCAQRISIALTEGFELSITHVWLAQRSDPLVCVCVCVDKITPLCR